MTVRGLGYRATFNRLYMGDIGEDQDFESTVRYQVFEKVNKYIVRKMLSFF